MLAVIGPTLELAALRARRSAAMLLVGGLFVVARVSLAPGAAAEAAEQVPLLRALAFRTILFVVLPAFVAMHVFGALLANRSSEHGRPRLARHRLHASPTPAIIVA